MTSGISRQRRRLAEQLTRRNWHKLTATVSPDGFMTYVVGALVADDHGVITRATLEEGSADREVVEAARKILTTVATDLRRSN